jgi:hypothetical protein
MMRGWSMTLLGVALLSNVWSGSNVYGQSLETPALDGFIDYAQSGALLTMTFEAVSEDDFTGQRAELSGDVVLGVGFSRFETDDRIIVIIEDTSWVMDLSQNRVIISDLDPEAQEFSVEWLLQENESSMASDSIGGEEVTQDDASMSQPWTLDNVERDTFQGQDAEKLTVSSTDPFSTWESAFLWIAIDPLESDASSQMDGRPIGYPIRLVVQDPVGAMTTTTFSNHAWSELDKRSIMNPLESSVLPNDVKTMDTPWTLPVTPSTQINDIRESPVNKGGAL